MQRLPLWSDLLDARDALTEKMEMETCDGCNGCRHRCLDGFTVTREEYDAAIAYLATLPDEPKNRILTQNKVLPWPGTEETPETSEPLTYTQCRFHDTENGMCLIYPVRPTVCRLFGHTHWLPCPIEAVTQYPEGSPELWQEYREFERKTYAEWERFLMLL
jgi:Fe-S-cluster containining protein